MVWQLFILYSSSFMPLYEPHRDVNEATTRRGRVRDARGQGQDLRRQDPRGQVNEAAEVWKTGKFVMGH